MQMFFKNGDLRNFTIFTGKHLGWSHFLNKVSGRPFVNLGIGIGIGIDITNDIISSSIRPMELKLSREIT